jgi:large subunit ribosomal protein L37Ae
MATKKIGSAGRFGVRYGTKVKNIIRDVESRQKQKQECPYCERPALKRLASGIWQCKKCNSKFAGAAYFPKSPAKAVQTEEKKTEEEA